MRTLENGKTIENEKLETLRRAALEGFQQLDKGLGIELHGENELREFIARIGHRASHTDSPEAAHSGKLGHFHPPLR